MLGTPLSRAAGLGLAVVALSSCGQSNPGAALNGQTAAPAQNAVGPHGHGKHLGGALAIFAGLDLTEAQRTQLRAIGDKYRAQWPVPPWQRVRELLVAESVDAAALRQALNAPSDADARHRMMGEMLKEGRAVLTDAQRSTLVSRLQAVTIPTVSPAPAPSPSEAERTEWLDRMADKLALSAPQKTAFATYMDRQRAATAAHPAPPVEPRARRDALVTFLQTGDAGALDAIKPADPPPAAFALEEFVALATQLNVTQRQALFGRRGHRKP